MKSQQTYSQSTSQLDDESTQQREASELYIWGNDYYGQLGVGQDRVQHPVPKICSFNILIAQVSCGEDHTVFVSAPQEGSYVYAMGSNQDGKLGINSADIQSCNVPTLVEGVRGIAKVACGQSHTLALGYEGDCYSWGQGFFGALGNESSRSVHQPERVKLDEIVDVEAGGRHSLFITAKKQIFVCGDASEGQLGLEPRPNMDRVHKPQKLSHFEGQNIEMAACGKLHTLILIDGQIWYLGDKRAPFKMNLPERAVQVSAWYSSAALVQSGQLYVWASGEADRDPIKFEQRFSQMKVGSNFILMTDHEGRLLQWGQENAEEPTLQYVQGVEDKVAAHNGLGVGHSFAFVIGQASAPMVSTTEVDQSEIQISDQVEPACDPVKELRETLEQRIEQINNLEGTMKTLESEVEKLRENLKESKATNKDLEKQNQNLKTELTETQQAKRELEVQMAGLKDLNANLQQTVNDLRSQVRAPTPTRVQEKINKIELGQTINSQVSDRVAEVTLQRSNRGTPSRERVVPVAQRLPPKPQERFTAPSRSTERLGGHFKHEPIQRPRENETAKSQERLKQALTSSESFIRHSQEKLSQTQNYQSHTYQPHAERLSQTYTTNMPAERENRYASDYTRQQFERISSREGIKPKETDSPAFIKPQRVEVQPSLQTIPQHEDSRNPITASTRAFTQLYGHSVTSLHKASPSQKKEEPPISHPAYQTHEPRTYDSRKYRESQEPRSFKENSASLRQPNKEQPAERKYTIEVSDAEIRAPLGEADINRGGESREQSHERYKRRPPVQPSSQFGDLAKSLQTPQNNRPQIDTQMEKQPTFPAAASPVTRLDDIKSKLERYKREREELDKIRAKFSSNRQTIESAN